MANDITDLGWTDAYLLGYGPMDETHREFVEVVNALLTCADADIPERLRAFAAHGEAHFSAEDRWMRETDFPAADCHIGEHAAVMQSVREVMERVEAGELHHARSLAAELARWFPGHADYLDSALAHWMVKRRHGGKPVVLRRSSAAKGAAAGKPATDAAR